MITYRDSVDDLTPSMLSGFFVGWPNPPSPKTHLRLLQSSDRAIVALDRDLNAVVGFITAITDGVMYAAVPFLEVLPSHRGQGIGSELVRRMLVQLEGYYAIDVGCDESMFPFYQRFGFTPAGAAIMRRYELQAGR